MTIDDMGLIRVGCATPDIQSADLEQNTTNIIEVINFAEDNNTGLLFLPELAITGPDCGNLFKQQEMYAHQIICLDMIVASTYDMNVTVVLGYYEKEFNSLYKKNAVIRNGKLCYSFTNNSVSELNCSFFSHGAEDLSSVVLLDESNQISIGFSSDCHIQLLSSASHPKVGQVSSTINYSKAMSGSNHNILLTNDANGLCTISENGKLLSKKTHFSGEYIILSDVDIDIVNHDKSDISQLLCSYEKVLLPTLSTWDGESLLREISPNPFAPSSNEELFENCFEIFEIQANALSQRLQRTKSKSSIVGISGGLDSTLALLVTAYAHKKLQKDLGDIIAITMPGFGTTDRTYDNALNLMKSLGATTKEISIASAVTSHFKDIDHDINIHDVTYENAQARERTQILMDIANKENGIVIGTGDLSEEALGWCTFNGDHMSMFGVNAGVPKTVIQYIIRWFIDIKLNEEEPFSLNDSLLAKTLEDILNTPISPELLPPDKNGNMVQKTEENVGPYELHDFFIFHTVRYGTRPSKLLWLAEIAFDGKYSRDFILKWLDVFYKRFFTQQFKRSCSPDSPVIGTVDLSPTMWSMPSDASYATWLSATSKL